jgi:hypothetical protein
MWNVYGALSLRSVTGDACVTGPVSAQFTLLEVDLENAEGFMCTLQQGPTCNCSSNFGSWAFKQGQVSHS